MYQKRRKKEKEEKRKTSQKLEKQINKEQTANRYNRQNHKKNTATVTDLNSYHHLQPPAHFTNPLNSYTEGMRLWWKTYCTALQYHSEQQRQWKEADSIANEGHGIYSSTEEALLAKYAEEYETSSEEEEDEVDNVKYDLVHMEAEENQTFQSEDEEIDLEYLKFLEITHKHREELRLKREAESC